MDLAEDIKKVEMGWSPKPYIVDRATCMKSHAVAGNAQRAEEYAHDISNLQAAYADRKGFHHGYIPEGCEEWVLSPERWGWLLMDGHLVSRSFFPAIGATVEEALAEARRVNPVFDPRFREYHINAADISILNDVQLYARMAAE